jgi:ADP-ribosyl-[dinitrogen reductase] hydrolase
MTKEKRNGEDRKMKAEKEPSKMEPLDLSLSPEEELKLSKMDLPDWVKEVPGMLKILANSEEDTEPMPARARFVSPPKKSDPLRAGGKNHGQGEPSKLISMDKIRGCLLGVAIGDALGAPFEHLGPGPQQGMLEKTGGLITGFHHGPNFPAGTWTDDTGLSLATCRAFIEMHRTSKGLDECIRSAQEAWAGSDEARNPGRTVLYAAKYGEPVISSWANGALMRISPVGIYGHLRGLSKADTAALAYRIAMTTHGHPLALFPAVECALAIRSILSGEETVPSDLSDPGRYCGDFEPAQYVLYQRHRTLPLGELDPTSGLWMWRYVFEHSLGLSEGMPWNRLPWFGPGIIKTVNEGVDKDTAGAVAGAILGTYWGNELIPANWRSRVWKGAEITDLANRMIRTVTKELD